MVEKQNSDAHFHACKILIPQEHGLLIRCLDYHWMYTRGHLLSFLKVLPEEKKITHIQFTHYY